MTQQEIKISSIIVTDLNPSVYNPRKWNEQQEKHLKESIKKFGLVDPLIVNSAPNRKNIIIGGHFRFHIAKELGFKEIPVCYINIPDIEKEKELNLRLNRNTGEWDLDILKDFDIGLLLDIGFDDSDLGDIWNSMLDTEEDGFDVNKELAEIKIPKTQLGDIFQLGKHKLICGDCLDHDVISKLTDGKKVDMIYCDPPYNINLDYSKGVGKNSKYTNSEVKDNKKDDDYKHFLSKSLENALSVTEDNCHIFYWCDESYIGLVQYLFKDHKLDNKRVCFWIKNNHNQTPRIAFHKVYEPCVYAVKGKPFLSKDFSNYNEILNKEISHGNKGLEDIIDTFNIWLEKRLSASEYKHPTQKPLTLHEKPLKRCTRMGDNVIDLFGGSGSTLIACEQLKRNCLLVEIDPIFCDLIIKRYEEFTGSKAKKIS